MECYACDQAATRHCARCGKPYCPSHGGDPASGGQALCAQCLDPLSAAPSSAVFRASIFALLAASIFALWLLVRPPSVPGEGSPELRPQPTSQITPVPTKQPGATQGAGGSGTPVPGQGSGTPAPSGSATPAPTASPAPTPLEYTVQEGDTWYGIAEAYGVDATNLAAVNGLTLDDLLHAGQVIVIPR